MSTLASQVQELRQHARELDARSFEFAASLITQFDMKGRLSDKQAYWVGKLLGRATGPTPEPKTAQVGDLAGVYALFETAQKHLKFPAIVLHVHGVGDIRLNVAGQRARFHGSINVVNYASRDWYGRIHSDGKFEQSRKFDDLPDALVETLRRFAGDPATVAAEHGHLTGRCCFCNTALTDERSTSVGYGPVCAKNYGLPWGARVVELKRAA